MPDQENEETLAAIDDAIADVRASDETIDKEAIVGQLRAARHAVNGAPDKVQALAELVAIRTVAEALQAIKLPGIVRQQAAASVADHVAACAAMKAALQVDPNSKLGIFLACINSWPLAAVIIIIGTTALITGNVDQVKEIVKLFL
jgi:hypothetical protein